MVLSPGPARRAAGTVASWPASPDPRAPSWRYARPWYGVPITLTSSPPRSRTPW